MLFAVSFGELFFFDDGTTVGFSTTFGLFPPLARLALDAAAAFGTDGVAALSVLEGLSLALVAFLAVTTFFSEGLSPDLGDVTFNDWVVLVFFFLAGCFFMNSPVYWLPLSDKLTYRVCIYSALFQQSPKGRVFQEPWKPGMAS
jgi:hypothetical protein